jgi:hypothetical protein
LTHWRGASALNTSRKEMEISAHAEMLNASPWLDIDGLMP